jgi:hypothetical protein
VRGRSSGRQVICLPHSSWWRVVFQNLPRASSGRHWCMAPACASAATETNIHNTFDASASAACINVAMFIGAPQAPSGLHVCVARPCAAAATETTSTSHSIDAAASAVSFALFAGAPRAPSGLHVCVARPCAVAATETTPTTRLMPLPLCQCCYGDTTWRC